jgi:hypothetical protein
MIRRHLIPALNQSLARFPVVALVGARQVGKTTLARALAREWGKPAIYLDLERPSDLARLLAPELYLEQHADKLVILDEIQRMPELFPLLRALVDSRRRNGRFLILGSASPDLIRNASESLAGRIVYHELSPFTLTETGAAEKTWRKLWFRGGFPGSFLAKSEADAVAWREAFIQTHLERDIPQLGIRVPAAMLRRFWQMLAHVHGQLWNGTAIASGLGVSVPTVRHYLDILEDTFMLRQLQPYHANTRKRLVKTPKVYLRDSGLLHTLLHLAAPDDLFGHPALGASWEGWVIEQILAQLPAGSQAFFYRTSAGAEVDLVIQRPGRKPLLAIEIKYAADPAPARGFWNAMEDLGGAKAYVVCPARERYPLAKNVWVCPVTEIGQVFD